MRIGIVSDLSQVHRKWMEEAIAESSYQSFVVESMEEILSQKYDVVHYVYDDQLIEKLKEDKIDLVFNLANGYHNPKDRGELPELLDSHSIPYTGSNALGHRICDDKSLASMIFEKNHIATPKTIRIESLLDLVNLDFDFPLLVKPNNEGSGRGITNASLVYNKEALQEQVQNALESYDPPVLVTEFIDGSEVTLGLLGNGADLVCLTPLEIDFSHLPEGIEKIYSFEVKHEMEEIMGFNIPPNFSQEVIEEVKRVGKKAYTLLGLRDYARIDMRVRDGKAYILEINSLAGLNHSSSDIVKTASYDGIAYHELLDRIIKGAMKRYKIPMTPKEGNKKLEEISLIREEENERAREEEIEEYRKAGLLPQKEIEGKRLLEERKGPIQELIQHIDSLESNLLDVHESLLAIRNKLRELEAQEEKP